MPSFEVKFRGTKRTDKRNNEAGSPEGGYKFLYLCFLLNLRVIVPNCADSENILWKFSSPRFIPQKKFPLMLESGLRHSE